MNFKYLKIDERGRLVRAIADVEIQSLLDPKEVTSLGDKDLDSKFVLANYKRHFNILRRQISVSSRYAGGRDVSMPLMCFSSPYQ